MRIKLMQSRWAQRRLLALWVAVSAIGILQADTPTIESLTPSSGSGYAKSFEFLLKDNDSYNQISGMQPLFSVDGSYANACDFWIDVASKGIWLRSDDNTSWGSPAVAGQSGTLQNHQCILYAADSWIGQYVNDPNHSVLVRLRIKFIGAVDTRVVWDQVWETSGWYTPSPLVMGSWTVAADRQPQADSVAPGDGSTVPYEPQERVVSFNSSDGDDGVDISGLQLLVSGLNGSYANACDFWIDRATKGIWLRNDANDSWGSAVIADPSDLRTLQNTQCKVTAARSSFVASGTSLGINLAITFKSPFAGTRGVWMEMDDMGGLHTGPVQKATWTVVPPTTITLVPDFTDCQGHCTLSGSTVTLNSWGFGFRMSATVNGVAHTAVTWSMEPHTQDQWHNQWSSLSPSGTDEIFVAATYPPQGAPPTITVTGTAGDGTPAKLYMMLPGTSNQPPTISTNSPLPSGTVAAAYSQQFTASGGTPGYTWSVSAGSLPAGLALTSGGLLSGTPTVQGTSSFTILAADSASLQATKSFSLTIQAAGTPIITTSSPLPSGVVSTSYSQSLTASGGTTPYHWSVETGYTLPQGLTLSDGGTLSGAVSTANTFTFRLKVTDAATRATAQDFQLTIQAGNLITNLTQLQTCLDPNGQTNCTLSPQTYIVNSTINIRRYGVTLAGGGANREVTRLVRGPMLTDPLVRVAVTTTPDGPTLTMTGANASSGVVIQNLTFCGGGNTHPNTTPGGDLAAMSSGSPCGDQHLPAPTKCDYTTPCVDLSVDSVDSGQYPADPFSYSGPYALEINNVDLEDAPGHALSLYAAAGGTGYSPSYSPGLKVNDVWIHNSAIKYSAITGLLYGFNFVRYDFKYCDQYKDHNTYEFRDDPSLFAPRNIRVEDNTFQYNNTGPTGGGAVRWVGLRRNKFFVNYISPQADNFGGGAIDFEGCTDKIDIAYNTITGPNYLPADMPPSGYTPFQQTGAMELYGRNINVHDNTITGHGSDGIGGYSLLNATISNNHVLQDNGWFYTQGGMEIGGSFPTGPCRDVPRDTNGITIAANDSNPIDVT